MVTYLFSNILGQTVTFNAAQDILQVANVNAASLTAETITGGNVRISHSSGSTILSGVSLEQFSLANLVMLDGSIWGFGNLATTTTDGGNDTIDFTANSALTGALNRGNQVNGLGGGDLINLNGSTSSNKLLGGSGGDTIIAGSGNNTIFGGSSVADSGDGGDSITIGAGNNLIYGNGGGDSVIFSSPTALGNSATFYGGVGGDTFTSATAAGNLFVDGGPDADNISITNSSANHTVFGGAGADSINLTGTFGTAIIYGGTGVVDTGDSDDKITLPGGSSTVYANGGADAVVFNATAGQTATVYLGGGNDTATSVAAPGSYMVFGGGGGDNMNFTNHTGSITVYGGTGVNDSGDGADTIISGASSNILIYGNGGNDSITAVAGLNSTAVVFAGVGDDTVGTAPTSGSANVQLYGNSGNNTFSLNFTSASPQVRLMDYGSSSGNKVNVTLSGGNAANDLTVTREAGRTVISRPGAETIILEGFTGNLNNDSFIINGGSRLMTNFGGSATSITGSDNDDLILTGNNGDTVAAGAGADLITGGSGNDTFSFRTANFNASDTISGGAGTNVLSLDTPGTPIIDSMFQNTSNVQIIKLTGDFSTNGVTVSSLASLAGARAIDASGASKANINALGMLQSTTITGGSGNDTIVASPHDDTITGGGGDDVITGNNGDDSITGGAGKDIFDYFSSNGSISLEGFDRITDFDNGTSTTTEDTLRFKVGEGFYNLGNNDTVVDAAIVSSIAGAGAGGTEIIILTTVGIASSQITSALDTLNVNIPSNRGVINVFYETTLGHAVVYYDTNGQQSGGHVPLVYLTSVTTLAEMADFNFADFVFTL